VKRYGFARGSAWAFDVVAALDVPITSDWVRDKPRYVFYLNWSKIVPAAITEAYECVNFHCTPLPFGRGGHPIENLILRGHTETVITAHRMTEQVDAGPIYCVSDPVSLAGSKAEILARFVEPVAEMIRDIVDNEPEPREQEGEVVEFKRLPIHECERIWAGR